MALDVIFALSEELDSYTPCILVPNDVKQENNFTRLHFLVRKTIDTSMRKFNRAQQGKVLEALRYAAEKHQNFRRDDKVTPYLLHILEVVCILIDMQVYDYKTIVAATLHDVVEDTEATLKDIAKTFGVSISRMVDLLSKHPNFIRKKFYWVRMKNEPNLHILWRVLVIKFGDRIHNMMTLDVVSKERREKKLAETEREFPELYKVLVKTFRKLRKKNIFTAKRYLYLPFHLNNRLFYEMEKYR
jgi:(p)ppGpp synthase/HD superfamily hydrolase